MCTFLAMRPSAHSHDPFPSHSPASRTNQWSGLQRNLQHAGQIMRSRTYLPSPGRRPMVWNSGLKERCSSLAQGLSHWPSGDSHPWKVHLAPTLPWPLQSGHSYVSRGAMV